MSVARIEETDRRRDHAKDRERDQVKDRGNSGNALLQRAISEAFALLNAGASKEATAHIKQYSDLAARSEAGCYIFGLIYFNADELRSSLMWFERALALNPNYFEALNGSAIVLQRLGQPLDALKAFEALVKLQPNDADTLFGMGAILQSLGRMNDALTAYENAFRCRPTHCEALTNRGALLERFGRLAEALACFDAIEAIKPDDSRNLFNKGSVLQRLGRCEEALVAYDEAARRGPADAETELNRGNVLQKLGRLEEAIACYDRSLQYRQGYPQAYYNKGIALYGLGRRQEALAAYDAALALDPSYCEASCNRGNILHEQGQLVEALAAYNSALNVRPGFLPALTNRANLFLKMGRAEQAASACEEALRHDPKHPQAVGIRGAALYELGRFPEALTALDQALQINPGAAEAWLNRGNVLQELDRHEEAVASYNEALRLRPNYPEALSSLGVASKETGEIEKALACFDAALAHKPDFADARNNRAGALLLKGELKSGFEDFESRWDRSNAPPKTLTLPALTWRGQEADGHQIEGRKIIVWDEQGLGDLIQFSRYLPLLSELGAEVTLFCRKNMQRLLGTLPAPIRFIDAIDSNETFAFQSSLLSLPHSFQTTIETIPGPAAYLRAESELVEKWAKRLGREGFRIGVCWRGNQFINLKRSLPLPCFAPVAGIKGVRLISLMKEQGRGETAIGSGNFVIENLGPEFDAGFDSFIDCAAVMANLDLIITSDTAIAHLAGALGRPVFVALKQIPDWRWLMGRADCPWYPSVRLFRQSERGRWEGVFAEISAEVEARIAGRAGPSPTTSPSPAKSEITIPSAIGELIDKITILELKERHIGDEAKLANIRHELALLRELQTQSGFSGPQLEKLKTDLKSANALLCDVETALREHEARADFGAEFVALARQVYKSNDYRADLKKKINLLCNSAIVEEKSYSHPELKRAN